MIICVIALVGKSQIHILCSWPSTEELVAANMFGQVNDLPPMDDFSDFYNPGLGH